MVYSFKLKSILSGCYIIILPAFGIISEALSYRSQKFLFGRVGMIYAIICIGVLGWIVWAHHMYSTGLEVGVRAYFTGATLAIALPTGVKIWSWLATLFGSKHLSGSALDLYLIGFLILFTIGGVTGVILANAGVDLSLHDTYYVVGHFHYVLSLGALSGVIIGYLNWSEQILNKKYNELLAKVHFYIFFISANMIFFPMHFLGLSGLPRRYIDYPDNYEYWNKVISYGSFLSLFLIILTCILIINQLNNKAGINNQSKLGDFYNIKYINWNTSLERALTSPIPFHSFNENPLITKR